MHLKVVGRKSPVFSFSVLVAGTLSTPAPSAERDGARVLPLGARFVIDVPPYTSCGLHLLARQDTAYAVCATAIGGILRRAALFDIIDIRGTPFAYSPRAADSRTCLRFGFSFGSD